jgi:hypothetical protein
MRRGESPALRRRSVNLDRKVSEVREATGESLVSDHGRRDLTLPDIVGETLREHPKAELELRVASVAAARGCVACCGVERR